MDAERDFISVVILDNKAVVEEEARVALLTVGVEDLVIPGDVLTGFDHKSCLFVRVGPARFSGSFVVQHIGHWHKSVCFLSFYVHAEDARAHHHPHF